MKKEKIYVTACESCLNSDSCLLLNSYVCKSFSPAIDSNYKYLLDPELLRLETQSFALCLS
jgi:hypothetical protein